MRRRIKKSLVAIVVARPIVWFSKSFHLTATTMILCLLLLVTLPFWIVTVPICNALHQQQQQSQQHYYHTQSTRTRTTTSTTTAVNGAVPVHEVSEVVQTTDNEENKYNPMSKCDGNNETTTTRTRTTTTDRPKKEKQDNERNNDKTIPENVASTRTRQTNEFATDDDNDQDNDDDDDDQEDEDENDQEDEDEEEYPIKAFSLGVLQRYDTNVMTMTEFEDYYKEARSHLDNSLQQGQPRSLRKAAAQCIFKDDHCIEYAHYNDCTGDTAETEHWMTLYCCPICHATAHLEFLLRCPMDPNAYNAYSRAGEVSKKFLRMIRKLGEGTTTTTTTTISTTTTADQVIQVHAAPIPVHELLPHSGVQEHGYIMMEGAPWVVTIDNFVTDQEIYSLIQHGYKYGYERSTEHNQQQQQHHHHHSHHHHNDDDGSMESWEAHGLDDDDNDVMERTAYEAWCDETTDCTSDPVVLSLMDRLAYAVGIPQSHADAIELLRYDVGQYDTIHTDFHSYQVYGQTGTCVLTAILYLTKIDGDGGGGETQFPYLHDLTIVPKKGRLVLWSNVLDEDPKEEAVLARHRNLPVRGSEGNNHHHQKFTATVFFHARNFQSAPEYCHR